MEFVVILRNLMIEQNINQTQLAQKIGAKQAQVSEWLKGKAKPGYDTLKNMAIFLDVSADYLLGLEDETGAKTYNNYNNYGTHNGNVNF